MKPRDEGGERRDAASVLGIGPVRPASRARVWLPRWLDEELHERKAAWVGAGVLAGAVLLGAGYLGWIRPTAPAPEVKAAPQLLREPVTLPKTAAVEAPASDVTAVAALLPTCPHQHLDLALVGALQRACVGATQTMQTGSIRSLSVDPEGTSSWRLRVDMAGGQVIGARLSPTVSASDAFACADDCAGFTLSKPDAAGMRRLTARDVLLQPVAAGPGAARPDAASESKAPAAAKPQVMRLSATLAIAPAGGAQTRCAVPSLSVIEGGRSVDEFCPAAGAGFEIASDGHRSYRFLDFEGRSLTVVLDLGGAIDAVTLGELHCRAPACGGVTMHVKGNAESVGAERRFDFSGTTLMEPRSRQHLATLNGSVMMPKQD